MKKTGAGIGLGLASMAVCCAGHLLLLLGLPLVAVLTGQVLLVAAAPVVALVAIAVMIWRRRSGRRCAEETVDERTLHEQPAGPGR